MTDARLAGPAVTNLAGCALTPVGLDVFLGYLLSQLTSGERRVLVGHHNLHSLYLCQCDADVQGFYRNCRTCYIDGVGALLLLRAAGIDTRGAQRFSLMDCLPEVLDWAQEERLSVFYLGASPGAVTKARQWFARRWPRLRISLHHGYLQSTALTASVNTQINKLKPDVLLVGMGMPSQERWISAHYHALDVGVILQAGGTLDYYTGMQRRPPWALSRLGLAWLYRLLHNPRRLWRRYLLTPWSLLGPTWRLRRALSREKKVL